MGNSESSDDREDSLSSESISSAIAATAAIAAGAMVAAAAYSELKEKQAANNALTERSQSLQVYNANRGQSRKRSCPLCVTKVSLRWMTLSCDHKFHVDCFEKWCRTHKFECPLC